MGDHGRWFKLWITAPDDPSLSVLPLSDFGCWAKFGTYMKAHGTAGTIDLAEPPPSVIHPLTAAFQCPDFGATIAILKRFPHCRVTLVTNEPVTWRVTWANWRKYQDDNSRDRVQAFRERQRATKRKGVTAIEETRRDEKRREETTTPPTPPKGASQAREWIELLNRLTGRTFEPGEQYLKHIRTRMRAGRTLADAGTVIRDRIVRWAQDEEKREWLRPETLFGVKFDTYLALAKRPQIGRRDNGHPDPPEEHHDDPRE